MEQQSFSTPAVPDLSLPNSRLTPETISETKMLPFHAEITGTVRATLTESGFLSVKIVGHGDATQLGHFSGVQHHLTNPATWKSTDGRFTFTIADGDSIHGTYTGYGVPAKGGGLRIGGMWSIDGGTGAFADVVGRGTATGRHFSDGGCFIVLDGTMSPADSLNVPVDRLLGEQ